MKILLLSLAFFSSSLMAMEISIVPGNVPGKIVCPESKKTYKKSVVIADPYELPEEEDLDSILSETFLTSKTQKLLAHNKIKDSHVPSIAIWGDSHMAAAFLTDELINIFGIKKESVRSRFISPTMGRAGVRLPIKQYCQSKSWSYDYAYRNNNETSYLKSLAKLKANQPNSYIWVDFSVPESGDKLKKLKIKFSSSLKTKLAISLDDGEEKILDITPSVNFQELVLTSTSEKFSLLKMKLLEGQISIDGFIPTYSETPLLYLDLMAIPGATINGWHHFDEKHSFEQDLVDYDLAILSFGTNEGNDSNFDAQKYSKNLESALIKFKASNPNSTCLLIGPTDRGVLVKRSGKQKNSKNKKKLAKVDLLKYSLIHQKISTIQNTLSSQYGCTFWSWQDAMGGVGGAYRWLKGSPKLMANDLTHLTINGYQRSAFILNADVGIKKALGFE